MSELSEQILACVVATNETVNDYDQRSALGMARTWVDKRNPIKWNPDQIEYPRRDQLARELVAIMEEAGAENEVYIAALNNARVVVNAVYINPTMLGYRARQAKRGELLAPGDKKKAKAGSD